MTNTIDLQKDCKYIKTAPSDLYYQNLKEQLKPGRESEQFLNERYLNRKKSI